jgi:CheY-like chemotaxis protein
MNDSETNAGSRAGQPSAQAVPPHVRQSKVRLRILLVEDSPTNQLIAKMNLEQAGHVVTVVDNGREAVRALEEPGFDLVLMDVLMPEMDGTEAARIIRRREVGSGRHIPIVAITATDTQEHRETCLEAGMDDFVSKPLNLHELHRVIERMSRLLIDENDLAPD